MPLSMPGLLFLIAFVLGIPVVLVVSLWGIRWRAGRLLKQEERRLRQAPIADLVEQVRKAIRFERWERFPSGARLLQTEATWNAASLLECLDALFLELTQADQAKGQQGRDSNYFEFYDCGLAGIAEALKGRVNM